MRKYAYCRVSTDEQGISGNGLEHQRCESLRLGMTSEFQWGRECYPTENDASGRVCTQSGFFVDVISAYKIPFHKRPAGKALLSVLDPGDTIILSRLDRGFRSVADFCSFIELARKNQWNVICGDPPIDLATPEGRLFARLAASIAEWHSDMNSVRVKEALAAKKLAGLESRDGETVRTQSMPSDYRPGARAAEWQLDTVKPGRIFVYIRCSHRSSVESGLGLRHQMTACCAYADGLRERHPQLEWNETIFTDPAVSSLAVQLASRPQGSKMDKELREGDVVICLRPDRVFGSIADMSRVLQDWKKRGISLHFAQGGLDLSSAYGEMLLNVLVSFAQFERRIASARAKECRSVLVGQGKFTGGRRGYFPPFYRQSVTTVETNVGGKRKRVLQRRLVLDPKQIATFRLLLFLRRKMGSLKGALGRTEQLIAKREGREPIPHCGCHKKGKWEGVGDQYVPTASGNIYPMWTSRKYEVAILVWEEALAAWRSKAAEERAFLQRLSDESGYRRHRASPLYPPRRAWWWPKRRIRNDKTPCSGVG